MKYEFVYLSSDGEEIETTTSGQSYSECAKKARKVAEEKADKSDDYLVKLICASRIQVYPTKPKVSDALEDTDIAIDPLNDAEPLPNEDADAA